MSNLEKKLLRVLNGEAQKIPPIWLMRQAGRYLQEYRNLRKDVPNFLSLCYSPQKACEITLQPIRRFHFDAAILFSDILVVPHALGQSVTFVPGKGPQLEAIRTKEGLTKLKLEDIHKTLAPIYETIKLVKKDLPHDVALIGFAGSPWTVATYVVEGQSSRDYIEIKKWLYRDPEGFKALINILTQATIEYLSRQIEAGAEVIQLFDSWAGVLSTQEFNNWVIEPTLKIASTLKEKYPHIPLIGFPRLAGANLIPYAKKVPLEGISLDTTIPLDWAKAVIPSKIALQGNLDPMALLIGGPSMDKAIDYILESMEGRSFIFNLGHGIHKQTPLEHVQRLIKRIREHS